MRNISYEITQSKPFIAIKYWWSQSEILKKNSSRDFKSLFFDRQHSLPINYGFSKKLHFFMKKNSRKSLNINKNERQQKEKSEENFNKKFGEKCLRKKSWIFRMKVMGIIWALHSKEITLSMQIQIFSEILRTWGTPQRSNKKESKKSLICRLYLWYLCPSSMTSFLANLEKSKVLFSKNKNKSKWIFTKNTQYSHFGTIKFFVLAQSVGTNLTQTIEEKCLGGLIN